MQTPAVILCLLLPGLAVAVEPPTLPVTYLGHTEVAAAFLKGQRFVTSANYNVSASRRDQVGTAEIHEHDTDIFYFQKGHATFVTGGELVDGRETGPGEWRGSKLTGGTIHEVSAGDVIVVPPRTTHWFSQIEGEIVYYIVKVTE